MSSIIPISLTASEIRTETLDRLAQKMGASLVVALSLFVLIQLYHRRLCCSQIVPVTSVRETHIEIENSVQDQLCVLVGPASDPDDLRTTLVLDR